MKLTDKEITYVEQMMSKIIESLKQVNKELKENDNHIFASKARAKFDKLRIELGSELLQIKKRLYNEKL